jgi:hypothetical protein
MKYCFAIYSHHYFIFKGVREIASLNSLGRQQSQMTINDASANDN